MTIYNDYPLDEIGKTVDDVIAKGGTCYQKFTCENCGSRQTIDVPNTFYTSGQCEECKHVTDIKKRGCNFIATFNMPRKGL